MPMTSTNTKYPFAPLAAAMCMTEAQACRELGINGSKMNYRHTGMSEKVADRMAVKAGLIAYEVWPQILDNAIRDVEDIDYKIAKKARERRAAYRRRRYQSDAATRERQRAAAAAYKAATAEYKRRQDAEYRRRNAEHRRAVERARYERNRDAILARQRARRARSSQPADAMVA